MRDGEEYTSVAAGEDLAVEVTFRNPLALKLRLTDMRLLCEFTPAAEGTRQQQQDQQQQEEQQQQMDGSGGAGGGSGAPDPSAVQVAVSRLTLHPSEVLTERLTLRPLSPGWLRVTGVAWVVEGGAEGRAAFSIKGRHRKHPKGDRCVTAGGGGWLAGLCVAETGAALGFCVWLRCGGLARLLGVLGSP